MWIVLFRNSDGRWMPTGPGYVFYKTEAEALEHRDNCRYPDGFTVEAFKLVEDN